MVSDKVFTTDGSQTIFSSDFEVISEDHLRVFFGSTVQSRDDYDLINNAAVFHTAPTTGLTLTVQVGTTPADILSAPTDAGIVAGNIANVNTVAGISGDVTVVAGISADVTAVKNDAVDIGAVAGKATEIGRLGTSDAVADMAILGTAAIVADMAILGTADVVSDMNVLGTADVVSDMNTLGTADVVSDMNILATADVVSDMNVLATADIVADLNTLGTADVVSDMNTLGTATNVTNMSTVAGSIADVNRYANEYTINATAPSSPDEGDLWYDSVNNLLKYYTGSAWSAISAAGISNVVEDTTPQLGGNLDMNSKTIAGVDSTEMAILDGATVTTAELNILDGVTSTTAELNLLDGVTSTTAELNLLDGVTSTTSELNLLDGVTSTTAELNYTDGVTSDIQTQLDAKVAKTSANGSAVLPSGTTVQRDGSPSAGYIRWNTTDTSAEVYDGSAWAAVGGGNSTTEGLYEHAHTINTAYSITSTNNAMSAGPVVIGSSGSVTVPATSVWTIV